MAREPEEGLNPDTPGAGEVRVTEPPGAVGGGAGARAEASDPPRRARFHHGNLRAAALEAARDLVRRQGPEALSLREVAKAAGVNHRALYRHYADKDDLAAALAAEGFTAMAAGMGAALAGEPDRRRHGVAVMAAYVRFALDNPRIYGLMFGMRGEAFLRHPVLAPAVALVTEHCATAFRRPEDPPGFSFGLRDRVMAAWGRAHGLVDLWLRGALRARGPDEAYAYIVGLLAIEDGP